MAPIKRYAIDVDLWERDAWLTDKPDGKYVLYSDHEEEVNKLKIELELLREKAWMYDELSK